MNKSKPVSENIQSLVKNNLKLLDKRRVLILTLRLGLDGEGSRKASQVGVVFNITNQRVYQIETSALRKIWKHTRDSSFKEFLEERYKYFRTVPL